MLVLGGISKIFAIKRSQLLSLRDFPKAWFFFLQYMAAAAGSLNDEVSLAALKSFQEALVLTDPATSPGGKTGKPSHAKAQQL